MKEKFTCAKCGKQNVFDSEKVRTRYNLIERTGAPTQPLTSPNVTTAAKRTR